MGRWIGKKWRKVGESVNIKKWFNIKKRKIGKKNYNDVNVDVAQLGRNNNKCYISVYIYIYIYVCMYMYVCIFIFIFLAGCGTIGAQSGAETKGRLWGNNSYKTSS